MIHDCRFPDVIFLVNELSGTIDLESTLIRAEALFRKFVRLIEAIDKKPNFPAPRLNVSSPPPSVSPATANSPSTTPSSSNNNNKNQQQQQQQRTGKKSEPSKSPEPTKVITPELRRLLSREVVVLPRKDVANNGDGFLAKPDRAHMM